jgi:hypothetical protein
MVARQGKPSLLPDSMSPIDASNGFGSWLTRACASDDIRRGCTRHVTSHSSGGIKPDGDADLVGEISVCGPMEEHVLAKLTGRQGASAALQFGDDTSLHSTPPISPKAQAATPIEPFIVSILHLICHRAILDALDPVCRLPCPRVHDSNQHD